MLNWLALSKSLLEGLAVALAAYFIPRKETNLMSIIIIALTAAAVFSILDYFAPEIGMGARQGSGFGIGLNTVGWGSGLSSLIGGSQSGGFEDCKFTCANNPNKCKQPGPCQRVGGGVSDSMGGSCSLQQILSDNSEVSCGRSQPNWDNCLPPVDVAFLKEPNGMRGLGTDWSQTNVGSRPMVFTELGCPVNPNINEYKLVPGLYSKYALKSGYDQNVGTYNEVEYRD